MTDIDFPPLPAEVWGAIIVGAGSVITWLFARADRTADRRVEALEAITRSLNERVAVLETSRERAEAARDSAEEEAHRLRLKAFRLEEYAAALIRWGVALIKMISPDQRPPAPPSPPACFEDGSDLGGGLVAASAVPLRSPSFDVPGDASAGQGDANPVGSAALTDECFAGAGSDGQLGSVEADRVDDGEGF